MFDSISTKLNDIFFMLGKKGTLSEKDIDKVLREIRIALLEADVGFKVVKQIIENIREKCNSVELRTSVAPSQVILNVTSEVLTSILGSEVSELQLKSESIPVILIVGLNGSGKTTTTAKLAAHLKTNGQTPVLIAADIHRPAAVEQLNILGDSIEVAVYSPKISDSAPEVVTRGIEFATKRQATCILIDTAGRFQVDEDLMKELKQIYAKANPIETLLVLDAMAGQDSVNVAETFAKDIGLTGVVLTKIDGDARGGAALSVVYTTGVPLKFLGTGEKINDIEIFHPDRIASRILGMGDIAGLSEIAGKSFSHNQAKQLEKKIKRDEFDLNDLVAQMNQIKKMGSLTGLIEKIPGLSKKNIQLPNGEDGEKNLRKIEAIVSSMTLNERRKPGIIDGSRRRRIAKGSGTKPNDVNNLLNQFSQMKKMMKRMSKGDLKGLSMFR
ncbi:MAG: signal recognition particle protein [SAR202 cluster bacterium]|nr:signal recognition particle protein [Chloroflexota bacterium]MQG39622.1 signal recognition particle protein [SAR202 cluster bacterium]|tara:strand:+ start:7313 stop:8638 length:1326 start_codon:yes stop_codon:yes gene_type:complete